MDMTMPDFLASPDPEMSDLGAFDLNYGTLMLATTYNLCIQLLGNLPS